MKTGESEFPMYFYGMIIAVYALHQVIIIMPILTIILTLTLPCTNVALKLKIFFFFLNEIGVIKRRPRQNLKSREYSPESSIQRDPEISWAT